MPHKVTGTYPKCHSHKAMKCQDRDNISLSTLSIECRYKESLWIT